MLCFISVKTVYLVNFPVELQDVQFTIGGSSKMSVALWYPVDGNPWHGSGHYTINCDWVSLDFASGGSNLTGSTKPSSSWDVASAFSLLFSVAALCVAIFVAYQVSRPKSCCKPDSILKRGTHGCHCGTHGCHCVYPIKLDLLLNVSQNADRNAFLVEFTSQLDLLPYEIINFYMLSLSRLNLSMDIIPHTGISFSASDASKINSSHVMHRVRFDPSVVGDYKILNFTWFEPPAPSPVLIICLCTFHEGKTKASPKESVKPRTTDAVAQAGSFPHPSSTRFLQYEELKEATNNFASSSILGEGGFGRVFKGVLSDGTAVAIKRLTNGGPQGDKEFLVEVEMLSRLHHRNLVKLIGYHSSRKSSQNLLCYELVPNGSLEAWLHGPLGVKSPLDWDTRMKIALDAARGLAYLHEDSQPCVIHRDFKAPTYYSRITFMLKLPILALPNKHPKAEQITYLLAYVAPEYAMTGHLLVKSEVYSFGVVLLELLTGRTPRVVLLYGA
ncbi:hypothetical protein F3Y22_tig00116951pilonHSYRG00420 [Hibiscus syriacus]|uniref:Protein kinase domain-containing protein n=1 Tax=Hibiscus syriacus TaxID=106335 RepID=A0A6A2WY88_HIBSY|nr:hypothetical protein F3Y22_tig00116951pilonHSYRG00420 [Hibiscus syriacus]